MSTFNFRELCSVLLTKQQLNIVTNYRLSCSFLLRCNEFAVLFDKFDNIWNHKRCVKIFTCTCYHQVSRNKSFFSRWIHLFCVFCWLTNTWSWFLIIVSVLHLIVCSLLGKSARFHLLNAKLRKIRDDRIVQTVFPCFLLVF